MKRSIFALALFGALGGCGGQPRPSGKEICDDGYDNDGDGKADCVDEDCVGAAVDLDGDGEAEGCPELCTDQIDNDGDGLVDCEDPACDGSGCPEVCTDGRDNDKDTRWDCDDTDDCSEVCDVDEDGSFNADFGGDDCDDTNPAMYPGAVEICDGFDNDCNELTDRDDPELDPDTLIDWYADSDGDGYGQDNDVILECMQPAGRVELPGDCHDGDPLRNPAALEVCDGVDNDCDGLIDDADPSHDPGSALTWYPDVDGDGFGEAVIGVEYCTPPADHVTNGSDCDDANPQIGASGLWVLDTDGDGYGSGAGVGPAGCVPPGPGYVSQSLPADCDETNININPGELDLCGDGVDANCDLLDCNNWFEGFEAVLPQPPWSMGGDANWVLQSTYVHGGAAAAANGNINDSQESWMAIGETFPGGGNIVFWHRGSTETNYDYLKVYLNGTEVLSRSGTWSWTRADIPVDPGFYLIEFWYEKDASVSTGEDTVYIDDLELVGVNP